MFSPVVAEYWAGAFSGKDVGLPGFSIAISADLREDRQLMVLNSGGTVKAVLTPVLARTLGISGDGAPAAITEAEFRGMVREAGVELYGADHLYYFSEADREGLLGENAVTGVRRLGEADAEAFAVFESSASPEDLDAAYVELDHWAVFGAFVRERLASVASAYPWGDSRIADVGVLTLPEFRGCGHALSVVRALCKHAAEQGFEPQYRSQFDNEASIALAKSAGLKHFGTWEVISA